MKLVIDTQGNNIVCDMTENIGVLLTVLAGAKLYERWGTPYKQCGTAEKPETLEIKFAADSEFQDASPVLEKMTEAVKAAEARWLESYNKASEAEKKVKELEEKLKAITNVTTEPTIA